MASRPPAAPKRRNADRVHGTAAWLWNRRPDVRFSPLLLTARGPRSVFKQPSRLAEHPRAQENSLSGVSARLILVIARANQGSGIAAHSNTNSKGWTRRTATSLPQQTLRKRRGAACLNGRGETEKHSSIMSRDPHMDGLLHRVRPGQLFSSCSVSVVSRRFKTCPVSNFLVWRLDGAYVGVRRDAFCSGFCG